MGFVDALIPNFGRCTLDAGVVLPAEPFDEEVEVQIGSATSCFSEYQSREPTAFGDLTSCLHPLVQHVKEVACIPCWLSFADRHAVVINSCAKQLKMLFLHPLCSVLADLCRYPAFVLLLGLVSR